MLGYIFDGDDNLLVEEGEGKGNWERSRSRSRRGYCSDCEKKRAFLMSVVCLCGGGGCCEEREKRKVLSFLFIYDRS